MAMTNKEKRLRQYCVSLAAGAEVPTSAIIPLAKEIFDFVTGGEPVVEDPVEDIQNEF